jgi:hypothetical protein
VNWRGRAPVNLRDVVIGTVLLLPLFVALFIVDVMINNWKTAWSHLTEVITFIGLAGVCGIIFLLLYIVVVWLFSLTSRWKG